jgi:hypothetical protein
MAEVMEHREGLRPPSAEALSMEVEEVRWRLKEPVGARRN